MSAIDGPGDGPFETIQVLIILFPGFSRQDYNELASIFSTAKQHVNKTEPAFELTTAASAREITDSDGKPQKADNSLSTAKGDLEYYHVVILPGGPGILDLVYKSSTPTPDPIPLLLAYADLQKSDPSKERTLITTGSASLLLAKAGLLQGMAATTAPEYYAKLENLCKEAANHNAELQTDVMEENYVVNNARFDLGEDVDENPYILTKRPDGRRKSTARKGSVSWRQSVSRKESGARRAALQLGGLRVITAGGTQSNSARDAALYLVAAMVSHEASEGIAKSKGYQWQKGCTVDGIDV